MTSSALSNRGSRPIWSVLSDNPLTAPDLRSLKVDQNDHCGCDRLQAPLGGHVGFRVQAGLDAEPGSVDPNKEWRWRLR